jgi:hypothetical protein
MHYLLGLAALVIGAVIATRRTRPTWFVVLTAVLVGVGALLAILNYTRVTDSLGIVANNVLGWSFVGLSLITMLSAVFVLERRGERGEELPPLIGDNPFDGDTVDHDDPAPGQPNPEYTAAPTARAQYPGAAERAAGMDADSEVDADRRAAADAERRAAADGSGSLASSAGAAAATAAAFGDGIVPSAREAGALDEGGMAAAPAADSGAAAPAAPVADFGHDDTAAPAVDFGHDDTAAPAVDFGHDDTAAPAVDFGHDDSAAPAVDFGHDPVADADARAAYAPNGDGVSGPSDQAVDGTAVIGADPDIATAPAETDVDAAPEGGVNEHGTGEHGTDRA